MALYNLTDENVSNIFIFLKRVELIGSESAALVGILQAVQKPVTLPTKKLEPEPRAETPQPKRKPRSKKAAK